MESRRNFLKVAGITAGAMLLPPGSNLSQADAMIVHRESSVGHSDSKPDYTLRSKTAAIEIAPNRIVSLATYNGQFPGPLLRFKEGQEAVVDVYNETDVPEQLRWHGQIVPAEVDGAAEEGKARDFYWPGRAD